MITRDKLLFGATMSLALAFGFLHVFIPNYTYDFDRLHIFLFNLCSGASILLFFGSDEEVVKPKIFVYFGLALAYAITAFLDIFWLTILLSIPLVALAESVRIKRFGFFPFDFFKVRPTQDKFLQASLLCLSMGITIASLVIINNQYLHLFFLEKLTIDVFFLGYSFPLSLLTFSVMYTYMDQEGSRAYMILKEVSFWSITLGVIFFFVFIIFEVAIAEVIIANTLLAAVIMTYYIFVKHSHPFQQKWILSSGMMFLVITGITGVYYLFAYLFPSLEQYNPYMLVLHATVALYGWNLSGLFVIVRRQDFPIFRRVKYLIALHWITVLILAPLGKYMAAFALAGLLAYVVLLSAVFLSAGKKTIEET